MQLYNYIRQNIYFTDGNFENMESFLERANFSL